MDPLRRDDLDRAMRSSPEEKAAQALELMRFGFRLRRAALRAQAPNATDDDIEEAFQRWLRRDA